MNSVDLIPKVPKRKRQPTAACMREQLVLAADEIISLRQRLAVFCDPDAPYRLTVIRTDYGRLTAKQKEARAVGLLPTIRRIFRRAA